jgi:hypothetical protein
MPMRMIACTLLAASLAVAASLPKANVEGYYVEARTADVFTGSCYANAEVNLVGHEAVFGWMIEKGEFNGVSLAGLGVAAAVKASATLGDVHNTAYPIKSVLIVDEKATVEQKAALVAFAKRQAGVLLEDVVAVEARPMKLDIADNNIHARQVRFTAGDLAKIETRPLEEGDKICRHEEVYYDPLTKVDHAMAAYALDNRYTGNALGTTWSSAEKRSAFVGTFHLNE